MPICHQCSQGYEPTEEACPKCGAANPVHVKQVLGQPVPRCGQFAIICLWYAFGLSILVAGMALFSTVEAAGDGNFPRAALNLLVAFPALAGISIALRLAIRYAKGED